MGINRSDKYYGRGEHSVIGIPFETAQVSAMIQIYKKQCRGSNNSTPTSNAIAINYKRLLREATRPHAVGSLMTLHYFYAIAINSKRLPSTVTIASGYCERYVSENDDLQASFYRRFLFCWFGGRKNERGLQCQDTL